MENISTFFSLASLSLLLFWVGIVLLFFRIAPRFLPLLRLPRRYEFSIRKWLPFVELLVWLGIAVLAASWYASSSMVLFIIFSLFSVIIVLWIAWYYLRDLIAGVMIRREAFLKTGDIVVIGKAKGKVLAMGIQGLQLETGREEIIFIPYHQIITQPIYKTSVQRQRQAHNFRAQLAGESSAFMARKKVLRAVLLSPNVLTGEAVDIIVGSQDAAGRSIEIGVLLYDRERAGETERFIKGELAK